MVSEEPGASDRMPLILPPTGICPLARRRAGSARVNASVPRRADADVADLDQGQQPENDDGSIVEPIAMAISAA